MPKRKPIRARPDMAAYMRDYRRRKADAGRCSRCTARPPRPDLDTCTQCSEKGKVSVKKSRTKKRIRQLLGGY